MLVRLLDIRLDLLQTVHAKSLVLIFSKPMHLLFDLKLSVSSLPLLLVINYKSMAWMLLLLISMANLMRKFIWNNLPGSTMVQAEFANSYSPSTAWNRLVEIGTLSSTQHSNHLDSYSWLLTNVYMSIAILSLVLLLLLQSMLMTWLCVLEQTLNFLSLRGSWPPSSKSWT